MLMLFRTILDLYARNHDYTHVSKPSLTPLIRLSTLPSWYPLSVLLFCVPTGPAQVVCSCLKEAAPSQSLTLTVSPPSVPQCSWVDRGDKDVLFRAEQSMVTYSQHLDLLHVPALTLFTAGGGLTARPIYQSFSSRFTLQPMTSLAFLQSLYHQAWIPSNEADLKFIQKWLIAPEYSHTSGHEFLGR